jgi:dihydrofolate synthase/folylpolyglutamate synthase
VITKNKKQKTVLQTIRVLTAETQFKVNEEAIELGLNKVVKNTGLQGRWQQLKASPKTICDTAQQRRSGYSSKSDSKKNTSNYILFLV